MTAPRTRRESGAIHAWRQAPRAAKALIIGTLISRMAGFLQIFVVLYLTARGFPATAAAGALTAYGAGTCVGLLAGGSLADRLGVRRTIIASMAGSAALLIAIAYLGSYPAIVVTAGLAGAVSQAYRPAAAGMLSMVTPADRQVMIFSMQQLALNVGATAAPLLGVLFIEISYRLLFWGEATAALCYAVIAVFVLPRQAPGSLSADGPTGDSSPGRGPRGYLGVLADWRYLVFLSAMLINAVVYAQYISTLPLFLRQRGLPATVYGALLAFNSVVVIVGQIPITGLVQRHQPRVLVVTGMLLTGAGMTMYAPRWGLPGLATATLVWSLAECVGTPTMFFSYPAQAAPAGMRARYIGASQASFQVGYAIGPTLGVLVWHRVGNTVWWLCGVLSAAAAITAFNGVRTAGEREKIASPQVEGGQSA